MNKKYSFFLEKRVKLFQKIFQVTLAGSCENDRLAKDAFWQDLIRSLFGFLKSITENLAFVIEHLNFS
jgi:hypothetical protein